MKAGQAARQGVSAWVVGLGVVAALVLGMAAVHAVPSVSGEPGAKPQVTISSGGILIFFGQWPRALGDRGARVYYSHDPKPGNTRSWIPIPLTSANVSDYDSGHYQVTKTFPRWDGLLRTTFKVVPTKPAYPVSCTAHVGSRVVDSQGPEPTVICSSSPRPLS